MNVSLLPMWLVRGFCQITAESNLGILLADDPHENALTLSHAMPLESFAFGQTNTTA